MQLDQAIRDFETQLRANQRSPHTVSSYMRDLGEFRAWLASEAGPADVRRIDAATVCRFAMAHCVTHTEDRRPKRASSVDKVKMTLRALFRYLVDAGVIATNPARVLKYRRDHRVPEVLSPQERQRLLGVLDRGDGWRGARDAALVTLLLGTGLRLASVIALDATDVRLDDRFLVARKMKGGGEVRTALAESARARLVVWIAARSKLPTSCAALFVSGQMRRLSSRQVQVVVRKRLREAGIERRLTVHGLRHDFATRLYAKTKDLLLVQRAMNHRSVASTLVYARVADDLVENAVSDL